MDANKTGENVEPEKPKPIIHMHDMKQLGSPSTQSIHSARTKQPSPHPDMKHRRSPSPQPPHSARTKQSSQITRNNTSSKSDRASPSQDPTEPSHHASHGRHLEVENAQNARAISPQMSASSLFHASLKQVSFMAMKPDI